MKSSEQKTFGVESALSALRGLPKDIIALLSTTLLSVNTACTVEITRPIAISPEAEPALVLPDGPELKTGSDGKSPFELSSTQTWEEMKPDVLALFENAYKRFWAPAYGYNDVEPFTRVEALQCMRVSGTFNHTFRAPNMRDVVFDDRNWPLDDLNEAIQLGPNGATAKMMVVVSNPYDESAVRNGWDQSVVKFTWHHGEDGVEAEETPFYSTRFGFFTIEDAFRLEADEGGTVEKPKVHTFKAFCVHGPGCATPRVICERNFLVVGPESN